MSLIDKLRILYNLPLRESMYIVGNKIRPRSTVPLERILYSKQANINKSHEFFTRYERILARAADWRPLGFENARVLEIGCGPLLGFLPLAAFWGAEICTAVEPSFNPGVLENKQFEERYFKPMWNNMRHMYGELVPYDAFMQSIKATDVQRHPILDAEFRGPYDIILSNSCLEHIRPFEESMSRLGKIAGPDARYLHLVNFDNHLGTIYPFKSMYRTEPSNSSRKDLNFKRDPDVRRTLEAAGFEVNAYILDQADSLEEKQAEWWREHYSEDELLTRVILYFSA